MTANALPIPHENGGRKPARIHHGALGMKMGLKVGTVKPENGDRAYHLTE